MADTYYSNGTKNVMIKTMLSKNRTLLDQGKQIHQHLKQVQQTYLQLVIVSCILRQVVLIKGQNVFVSFEGTDNIQIGNISVF